MTVTDGFRQVADSIHERYLVVSQTIHQFTLNIRWLIDDFRDHQRGHEAFEGRYVAAKVAQERTPVHRAAVAGEAGDGAVAQEAKVAFAGMELRLEEHPARDVDRECRRPLDCGTGNLGILRILGYRPEKRELRDLLVHADDRRAGHRHLGVAESLAERHRSRLNLLKRLDRLGRLGDALHRHDAAFDRRLLAGG